MVESITREAVTSLGIIRKNKRKLLASKFVVFVGLLAGYGKSLCYA